jgi:hypothetical protein
MTERALQQSACDYLALALRPYGGFVSAIPGGDGKMTRAPGYRSGFPDLCIIVRGQAIFIELKSPKGRVKDHQRAVHADLERAGAIVHVARSLEDIEGIVRVLKMGAVRDDVVARETVGAG